MLRKPNLQVWKISAVDYKNMQKGAVNFGTLALNR